MYPKIFGCPSTFNKAWRSDLMGYAKDGEDDFSIRWNVVIFCEVN